MEVPPLPPKKRLVTAKDEMSKNRQVHRPGKEFNETKNQENMNDTITVEVKGQQKQQQIDSSGYLQSQGTSSSNRANHEATYGTTGPTNYASSQENIKRNSEAVMRQTQQQFDSSWSVQLQRTPLDDSTVPELPHRPIFVLPTQVDSKEMETFLTQEGDAPLLPPKKGKQKDKQKYLRSSEEEQAKNKVEQTYVGNASSSPLSPQRNAFFDDLAYLVVDVSDWRNIEKKCFAYAEVNDEGPPIDDSIYTEVKDEGPPIDDSMYTEVKDEGPPTDDEEYVPMAYIYQPMADQKATKDMGAEKGESANQFLAQNKISENVDLTNNEDEDHYEETTDWLETSPPEEFTTRKMKQQEDEKIMPSARNFRDNNNNNDSVEWSAKKCYDEVGGFQTSPMKVSKPKKKTQMIPTSSHFQRNDGFGDKSEGAVPRHASECQIGWISRRRDDDFEDFEDIENYFKQRRRLDAKVCKI